MNIDNYLKIIVNYPDLSTILSEKEIKLFNGMMLIIKNHYFLTIRQSEFLLKLLENSKDSLMCIMPELSEDLISPTWSKPFRQIEVVRRMYIDNPNGEQVIWIESNYSNEIRNVMSELGNTMNFHVVSTGKRYKVPLTEEYVVKLVSTLQPLNFNISDELLKYYDIITSWSINEVLDKFNIENITNEETKKLIIDDIGSDAPINSLIVNDRRIKYQYFNDSGYNTELSTERLSLLERIANRPSSIIWIDESLHSLTDIIKTLKQLKRFPILVTFPKYGNKNSTEQLTKLVTALDNNNITNDIGIYFRMKNTEDGKIFNNIIADKKYNTMLDTTTQVAGVETTHIPKFFLTSQWKPMAIISLTTNLRNSKTAIYAKRCDLNIVYSTTKPLIESKSY